MNDKYRNPFERIWCVEEIRETLNASQPLVIKCGAASGAQHSFREEWDQAVTSELVLSVNVEKAVLHVIISFESTGSEFVHSGMDTKCPLFCDRCL